MSFFVLQSSQNLYSTLSSPRFVTYMGIGDADIRMDVRQSENIAGVNGQDTCRIRIQSPRMVYRRKGTAFLYIIFVFFEHGGESKNKGLKKEVVCE